MEDRLLRDEELLESPESPREDDAFPGNVVNFRRGQAHSQFEFETRDLRNILEQSPGDNELRWIAFTGVVDPDAIHYLSSTLHIPPSLLMNATSEGDMHSMSGSSIIVSDEEQGVPTQVSSLDDFTNTSLFPLSNSLVNLLSRI